MPDKEAYVASNAATYIHSGLLAAAVTILSPLHFCSLPLLGQCLFPLWVGIGTHAYHTQSAATHATREKQWLSPRVLDYLKKLHPYPLQFIFPIANCLMWSSKYYIHIDLAWKQFVCLWKTTVQEHACMYILWVIIIIHVLPFWFCYWVISVH